MGILTDLLDEDAAPVVEPIRKPTAESEPTSTTFEKRSRHKVAGAVVVGDGLVRLIRSPPFPPEVSALDWGPQGVPAYVELRDEVYQLDGHSDRPRFTLVELRARPAWIVFDDVATPDASLCCPVCGRRLFYLSADGGAELCASCYPNFVPRVVPAEIDDESSPVGSVTFFLKPGVGLDW